MASLSEALNILLRHYGYSPSPGLKRALDYYVFNPEMLKTFPSVEAALRQIFGPNLPDGLSRDITDLVKIENESTDEAYRQGAYQRFLYERTPSENLGRMRVTGLPNLGAPEKSDSQQNLELLAASQINADKPDLSQKPDVTPPVFNLKAKDSELSLQTLEAEFSKILSPSEAKSAAQKLRRDKVDYLAFEAASFSPILTLSPAAHRAAKAEAFADFLQAQFENSLTPAQQLALSQDYSLIDFNRIYQTYSQDPASQEPQITANLPTLPQPIQNLVNQGFSKLQSKIGKAAAEKIGKKVGVEVGKAAAKTVAKEGAKAAAKLGAEAVAGTAVPLVGAVIVEVLDRVGSFVKKHAKTILEGIAGTVYFGLQNAGVAIGSIGTFFSTALAIVTAALIAVLTPLFLVLLSIPIFVALILFIVNNSAYIVPPSYTTFNTGGGGGGPGSGGVGGSGSCSPNTGLCSPSNLQSTFGSIQANNASIICNKESGGVAGALNNSCLTPCSAPGASNATSCSSVNSSACVNHCTTLGHSADYSAGLFQTNILCVTRIRQPDRNGAPRECTDAFTNARCIVYRDANGNVTGNNGGICCGGAANYAKICEVQDWTLLANCANYFWTAQNSIAYSDVQSSCGPNLNDRTWNPNEVPKGAWSTAITCNIHNSCP